MAGKHEKMNLEGSEENHKKVEKKILKSLFEVYQYVVDHKVLVQCEYG